MSPRLFASRRQICWFDRSGHQEELFESHLESAKAAMAEDEPVKFQCFVADGLGQGRRSEGFRKLVRLINEERLNRSDRKSERRFDRFGPSFDRSF